MKQILLISTMLLASCNNLTSYSGCIIIAESESCAILKAPDGHSIVLFDSHTSNAIVSTYNVGDTIK